MQPARANPLLFRTRVLVVENEPASLEIYRRLLIVWGCEPIVAVGIGAELLDDARKKASSYHCRIALVDMRLFDNRDKADISGLDLIAEIRPTVSIVVSAFGDERTMRDALRLKGAFDFFSKGDDPIKLSELVQGAAQSACLCRHSGRAHWHPTSPRDSDDIVLSGLPASARSLSLFYSDATAPQILGAVRSLLTFLRTWQHVSHPVHSTLYDLYLGAVQESIVQRAHHRDSPETISWMASWHEPIAWLAGHAMSSSVVAASQSVCHRMMNADEIFIDTQGEALLGNMTLAGLHHRLYDVVCLEIEIVTRLLTLSPAPIGLLFELVIALVAPTSVDAVLQPTTGVLANPEAAKAFSVIAGLRAVAIELFGYTDQREYLWGLLLELARRIVLASTAGEEQQRARIFAAVICRRLSCWELTNWLPVSWPDVLWADPPSHRREVVEQLFRSIAVAESCSFVGLPSMGKTHLLQHFATRTDVQQHYLGEKAAGVVLVFVDFDRLNELTSFHLYELLLAAVAESSAGHLAARQLSEELVALHRDVMVSGHALLAQRHLERAVSILCTHGLTVCFILDNFDKALQALPSQALDNLRALQTRHWNQLCYVVGLSQAPERTRAQGGGETFIDLIAPTVFWLSQYQVADANRVLDILVARYHLVLSEAERDKILWLSGRHPGLLEALCRAHWRDQRRQRADTDSSDAWLRWGWVQVLVQSECWKIWRVLDEDEQRALRGIARGESSDSNARAALERRGLLHDADTDQEHIFSPLFTHFVRTQETPDLLRIDRKAAKAWRGQTSLVLTTRLFTVLTLLYEHSGLVCTRDSILNHLYGEEGGRRAPNTVDTQIDRIREVIEPGKPPQYLLTVSGQGYRLVGTDIYPYFE